MARSTRVGEFADWASELTLDTVPARIVERARLQAMNTVAAGLAGSTSPAVGRLRQATSYWASDGQAGVIGTHEEWEPAAAAYANAAASIAHDWDDYLYMGHTGHSAVWAARAVGDLTGAPPDEILAAQIAANEIEGRLGAALFIGPHNGQFWSSIHCAGAAAAAGRLRHLEPEQTAHAIAIALYQPPFGLWPGFMGPDTKLLTAAEPVAQGIRAAIMAASGFTGPLDVIENPRGYLAHFSYAPRPERLEGVGEQWLTDTLAYKPYPGCAYLQSAIEAVLRLQREHEFDAGDVAQVDVRAGWLTTAMEKLSVGEPLTSVRVNFSLALSCAAALIARRLTHEELAPEWLADHDDGLRELASRVFVEHDWDMTEKTLEGIGASVSELPLRRLPSIRRRLHETGMDEIGLGLRDLREAARHVHWRGDTPPGGGQTRMTFPCHVLIHLHNGNLLESGGREQGSSGQPLDEQQQVVSDKFALVRDAVEMPKAWRRRPSRAAS